MRKRTFIMAIIAALVLGMLCGYAVFGASDGPGTDSDPLVSKSYVDTKLTYTPIQLTAGQKLIGKEGTEIILRSGEATAIDNGANGISDITAGTDLMTGMQVALNHLLLVPRDDGRGITAVTDIWVMIRGDYEIN